MPARGSIAQQGNAQHLRRWYAGLLRTVDQKPHGCAVRNVSKSADRCRRNQGILGICQLPEKGDGPRALSLGQGTDCTDKSFAIQLSETVAKCVARFPARN